MNLCGVGMSQGSEHLYIWYRVEDRQLKGEAGLEDWERSRHQLLVSLYSSTFLCLSLPTLEFLLFWDRSKLGAWTRHSLGAANLLRPGPSQDCLATHLLLSVWPPF